MCYKTHRGGTAAVTTLGAPLDVSDESYLLPEIYNNTGKGVYVLGNEEERTDTKRGSKDEKARRAIYDERKIQTRTSWKTRNNIRRVKRRDDGRGRKTKR